MLLTVTTTHRPATDLGYLLVKHPDRVQSVDVPTGTAHVLTATAIPLDEDAGPVIRSPGTARTSA